MRLPLLLRALFNYRLYVVPFFCSLGWKMVKLANLTNQLKYMKWINNLNGKFSHNQVIIEIIDTYGILHKFKIRDFNEDLSLAPWPDQSASWSFEWTPPFGCWRWPNSWLCGPGRYCCCRPSWCIWRAFSLEYYQTLKLKRFRSFSGKCFHFFSRSVSGKKAETFFRKKSGIF